jgi:hypothetical protein
VVERPNSKQLQYSREKKSALFMPLCVLFFIFIFIIIIIVFAVCIILDTTQNKNGKVYSSEYTEIQKVFFTLQHRM